MRSSAVKTQARNRRTENSLLRNEQGITLIVVLMVMAILLSIIGAGLMFSGINTKIAMNHRIGARAFNAADIGITAVASTLTISGATTVAPTALGNNLCYRSGYRDPSVPVSTAPVMRSTPGYSLGSGTGYNSVGYAFYQYPIAVTGTHITGSTCPTAGNETAARVVEAQVMFGPAPK
jgi:Tfp pilus assembly protein PilX